MSGDEGDGGSIAATPSEFSLSPGSSFTDPGSIAFGTPVLLKRKSDAITVDAPPLPSQPSPPPPVAKHPRCDQELVSRMCRLLRMGTKWMDTLRVAQRAAQEASGVMAAAMLRQLGAMREVSVWELAVESMMRDMSKLVNEAESDL